jgi:pilus assembly protein CpaC
MAQVAAVPTVQRSTTAQVTAGPSVQRSEAGEALHILVGHSVVIRTEPRLTRVLIGNPAVVTTVTTSPNEVVITAAATGSSSVVLWHENNQARIVEVFADLDVSMLRDATARNFPGEGIRIESEEGRVLLTGSTSFAAVADQIGKMAAPFSKEVVNSIRLTEAARPKQVMLKVRFAQVDRAKMTEFGINLFSTGAAQTWGAAGTQQFAPPQLVKAEGSGVTGSTIGLSDLLNIFLFQTDIHLGATIRDLQQRNILQILAEPNLLAMSGEPARFLAGGELPYPVVSGVAGATTVSVQFKPFGVKLEFTGTILSDNTIRLKVFPEVSSLDYTNAITVSGFVLPAIATRHAETVVELRDGQSFGIAGLLDQRTTALFSKTPGIADLPIIGQLFRSRATNTLNSELLVIVTPTIVDPVGNPGPPPQLPVVPIVPLDPKQFDKTVSGRPGGK